jgi:hypothetical protein
MSIVNFSGLEPGDLVEFASSSGTIAVQSTVKRTGSYALRCNALTVDSGWASIRQWGVTGKLLNLVGTIIGVTFYFRYATKPAVNSEEMFYIGGNLILRLTSAGKVDLYDNTTLTVAGTTVLSVDTWYRIEVLYKQGVDQTCEFKINGTVESSMLKSYAGATEVAFGKVTNRNGNTVDFFYDDIAIDDAVYPGAGECKLGLAIGAGAASNWVDGTGTTFAEVDDTPPGNDGNTTVIAGNNTRDNLDHTFDMQAFATIGIIGTILAVATLVVARTLSTASASTIAHRRIFNSTGFELTAFELTTVYVTLGMIDLVDPSAGGGVITQADFDSIEVGMAANTLAQTQQFTVVYVSCWSDGVAANPAYPQSLVRSQAVKRAAYW